MQAKRTGIQAEAVTMSCFSAHQLHCTFQFYMDQTYYVFHSWQCGSLTSIARKTFLCYYFKFFILFLLMASVICALFKFCGTNCILFLFHLLLFIFYPFRYRTSRFYFNLIAFCTLQHTSSHSSTYRQRKIC